MRTIAISNPITTMAAAIAVGWSLRFGEGRARGGEGFAVGATPAGRDTEATTGAGGGTLAVVGFTFGSVAFDVTRLLQFGHRPLPEE